MRNPFGKYTIGKYEFDNPENIPTLDTSIIYKKLINIQKIIGPELLKSLKEVIDKLEVIEKRKTKYTQQTAEEKFNSQDFSKNEDEIQSKDSIIKKFKDIRDRIDLIEVTPLAKQKKEIVDQCNEKLYSALIKLDIEPIVEKDLNKSEYLNEIVKYIKYHSSMEPAHLSHGTSISPERYQYHFWSFYYDFLSNLKHLWINSFNEFVESVKNHQLNEGFFLNG
jgi:hypothetical protein